MYGFQEKMTNEELESINAQAVFNGKIILVDTLAKMNEALNVLNNEEIVGFDCEWQPVTEAGKSRWAKVALIQISTQTEAYLFQTFRIGVPLALIKFLSSDKIKKIGLSLNDDFRSIKLRAPNIVFAGFIDLLKIVPEFGIKEKGLSKIYAILFNERISKAQQMSDWAQNKLTDEQLKYAALDAYACLRIYQCLLAKREEKE